MNINNRRSNIALRFAALMLLLWNFQANASTLTWTGSGANNNWGTANNWGGTAPSNTTPPEDLVFGALFAGSKTAPVDTISNLTINTLTIDSGKVTSMTLENNLTISGTNGGSGSTFQVPVTVTANTVTIDTGLNNSSTLSVTGGSLTLSGNVTNSGTIANSGATLTIGSAATVTGGTLTGTITNTGTVSGATIGTNTNSATINGGTVSGTTSGMFGTFNNVLFSGATLTNGSLSGANSATGANTFEGSITNSGTLTITSGTTTVSGTITNSGTTAITVGGTLNIASTGSVNSLSTLTEDSGGVVTLSGALQVATADLLGGSIDGTGSFTATTVNNGDGTNDVDNTEGVELYVGGSSAAGNTGDATDTFQTYNQDSGGALGIGFNSSYTGSDQLDVTSAANLNGTLDLYSSNGAELNLSSLNTADTYVLIDDSGGAVNGEFSAVNVLGDLAGQADGAAPIGGGEPGGWWIVYNGLAAGGNGDVELDYTPEPASDILLGGALVGLALLRRKLIKR